ncbi:hypothetical protein [Nocardioides panacisoli]|uniref:Uncharacterized protein n=1 Tax=Nocardioides panacisoli TaxID=627624 RepID=A0ABP7HVZ7_9ACTN
MGMFGDWKRMNDANNQYLASQGKRTGMFGQMADIPRNMNEAANNMEIGMLMMRHSQLVNGGGVHGIVTIDGVWHIATYAGMSEVYRIQGRVEREDGTEPYIAVFDDCIAQMSMARVVPGGQLAVAIDHQNPTDMGIDWIRTSRLPLPEGAAPPPGSPGARPAEPGARPE